MYRFPVHIDRPGQHLILDDTHALPLLDRINSNGQHLRLLGVLTETELANNPELWWWCEILRELEHIKYFPVTGQSDPDTIQTLIGGLAVYGKACELPRKQSPDSTDIAWRDILLQRLQHLIYVHHSLGYGYLDIAPTEDQQRRFEEEIDIFPRGSYFWCGESRVDIRLQDLQVCLPIATDYAHVHADCIQFVYAIRASESGKIHAHTLTDPISTPTFMEKVDTSEYRIWWPSNTWSETRAELRLERSKYAAHYLVKNDSKFRRISQRLMETIPRSNEALAVRDEFFAYRRPE